jgi:hypothetical protein
MMSASGSPPRNNGWWRGVQRFFNRSFNWVIQQLGLIGKFFWELIHTFFLTLRALLFVVIKTPYMLVPSSAHTSMQDESYSKSRNAKLISIINDLPGLDDREKNVIIENWIDQIGWTSSRAGRERDANELIRWWQIILGVLIPVLANLDRDVFNVTVWVSLAGIFVAVLTAIAQFRRPEERWRHYRVVNERYLSEFWNYAALAGEYAGFRESSDSGHKAAFAEFNSRMAQIKNEDIAKFFNEVVPPSRTQEAQAEQKPPPNSE